MHIHILFLVFALGLKMSRAAPDLNPSLHQIKQPNQTLRLFAKKPKKEREARYNIEHKNLVSNLKNSPDAQLSYMKTQFQYLVDTHSSSVVFP